MRVELNSALEGIWRLRRSPAHESRQLRRLVEITSRRRVFSRFLECSRMRGLFYHSVIHALSFFICFMIKILCAASRNNRAHRLTNWRNLIPLKYYIPRLQNFLLLHRELHHKFLQKKKMFFAISECWLEVLWWKTIKRAFSMFLLTNHGFLTNQSAMTYHACAVAIASYPKGCWYQPKHIP